MILYGIIIARVKAELMTRISKDYKNIDLNSIEDPVDRVLKNTNIE